MGSNIHITGREALKMTEVVEVLTFESDFIVLNTPLGRVEIEGEDMKIVNMSSESGELLAVGKIDGIFYSKKEKKKLFKKVGV